jgi:uncharacterized cupin superfamily protein
LVIFQRERINMAKQPLRLPALDPATVTATQGSNYPEQFKPRVAGRSKQRLGNALGLKNFGVNLTTITPGSASALRHWHTKQDEFVYIVSGELMLVTDAGEQLLTAGMCAGFLASKADGHHLVNRSVRDAVYLEVGDRTPGDAANYPDDDLIARAVDGGWQFVRKNGASY